MPHRIVPHLSPARLALYRAECKSNSDHRAGALYAWQIELHAAWYEVLGLVEMLLRHSLDNALGNWNHASPLPGGGTREWLVSAAKPLSSLSAKMARDARTEAQKVAKRRSRQHPRYGVTPTHDDFVAQLTFGNLAHLLPTKAAPTKRSTRATGLSGRENLWLHAAIDAFPNRHLVWPPGARKDTVGRKVCLGYHVGNSVERLRVLRNRVGHHEQTLSANHAARHEDALMLARAIDPDAAAAIADLSAVPRVLARRPRF
ncbi:MULTISPECIES: hypothetical protein [Actinomycetes]|uniref:Abi-like protein n=1 Tax=Nocardia farcinica TaxID=37329 RepID=A0A0H5PBL2_NOCFR|nr:hypothetical protein [Nocardia farcinica]PFW98649.1 hypothetical protein CJ469_06050 [Nocardia farcinica]PFX03263.1 hypothetical protein CJ468_05666 [Nocardia farcinica]CRY84639.1 Abi-like protein [Nocardia farcinica]SIT34610.1 hypothetical protein SAMN05421776_12823 [Nocardia farcinica]SUH41098.1 Abi-like protein [Nocardia farcinica]